MLTSKEQFAAFVSTDFDEYAVPGTGETVRLRVMDTTDIRKYEKLKADNRKNGLEEDSGVMALLCQLAIVDDNGKRVFSDANADAVAIAQWPFKVTVAIGRRVSQISAVSNEAIEDAVKNS